MDVVDAALGSSDMQSAAVEVNLIPTKAAHFRGAQPVAVCDQVHGGIAVPIAGPLAGGLLQPTWYSFELEDFRHPSACFDCSVDCAFELTVDPQRAVSAKGNTCVMKTAAMRLWDRSNNRC